MGHRTKRERGVMGRVLAQGKRDLTGGGDKKRWRDEFDQKVLYTCIKLSTNNYFLRSEK